MIVMIYNKYKDLLLGLNIDTIKTMEGVFNVDEIIDTFSNFYYEKMILDITAIRDYQNPDNLQKLAMNINMDNVILLLDNNPESETKSYLSKLVALGIYNFTRNSEGINYLIVHPHTYKDVANLDNLDEISTIEVEKNTDKQVNSDSIEPEKEFNYESKNENIEKKSFDETELEKDLSFKEDNYTSNNNLKIIGFKNATIHAGSTTLIYVLKKMLSLSKKVACIEVNKVDFLYFNDNELVSTTVVDLPKEIMNKKDCDYIFIDLNDYEDASICNDVYYLIEPSTIMINKMLKRNKNILTELKDKKIILNKCVLSSDDIAEFEYETKLKVLYSIPPFDDRKNKISEIEKFINKIV